MVGPLPPAALSVRLPKSTPPAASCQNPIVGALPRQARSLHGNFGPLPGACA